MILIINKIKFNNKSHYTEICSKIYDVKLV